MNIQKFLVKDGGEEYEFYIESDDTQNLELNGDEANYRSVDLPTVDMKKVHGIIRGYAKYAIGAFVNFGLAEIEEVNLEFNLKLAGKAGIPVLAEGSAETSLKVQVKCKFPDKK